MTKLSTEAHAALVAATVGADHVDIGAPDTSALARATYTEVAAALTACGAKWNRKRKVHVFTATWDAGMFADVVAMGDAPPKDPLAYFATPRAVADELIGQLEGAMHGPMRAGRVVLLEPSAGTGALAVAAVARWVTYAAKVDKDCGGCAWYDADPARLHVVLMELDPRRARILRTVVVPQLEAAMPGRVTAEVIEGDFLVATQATPPDVVLMNPPFSVKGDKHAWHTHVKRALEIVDPRGCVAAVIPGEWRWKDSPVMREALALVSRGDAWVFPDKAFKESGTTIETWGVVLQPGDRADPGTGTAVTVVVNTSALCDAVHATVTAHREAAGDDSPPDLTDPAGPMRVLAWSLTRAVATCSDDLSPSTEKRNGAPVSFSAEWQLEFARDLWTYASEP